MSLDVYLEGPEETAPCECARCGNKHARTSRANLFDWNITHNLGRMADEAGIYQHLWRPEELGIKTAGELIAPLAAGLERLRGDRARFERLNPENGWGDYRGLVRFVEAYLLACREHPDATVRADR